MLANLIELSNFLSKYADMVVLACLLICSIIFYRKQQSQTALIICLGMIVTSIGFILKFINVSTEISREYDPVSGAVTSETGNAGLWFAVTRNIIFWLGNLIFAVGFAKLALQKKMITSSSDSESEATTMDNLKG